jgi:hypothetical protein
MEENSGKENMVRADEMGHVRKRAFASARSQWLFGRLR